ncbi:MAG: chemotaxis protein CheW [Myxococcota bacterium]
MASAPQRPVVNTERPEQELFCFRLGEMDFGVPSGNVREVTRLGPMTPLPRTASFVLGVAGHRGEVLPVVDLLRFLGKGEAKVGPRTRLLVGMSGTLTAAVVADAVIGLKRIPVADILPPPLSGDAASEHLVGVVNPTDGQDALSVLDFAKLLQGARQRVVAR